MRCNDIQLFLIDYLDNELDDSSRDEIEKHLATCEKCASEVKELQMIQDTIEHTEMKEPGNRLRRNFTAMLKEEASITDNSAVLKELPSRKGMVIQWASPLWRAAAAVVVLLAGIGIGTRIKTGTRGATSEKLAQLTEQVKHMNTALQDTKAELMVNMLKDESASQRIEAVNYADGIVSSNQKVIDALVNTLNYDKSVNVRLAALYSLAKYTDDKIVIDSLVGSLGKQTEPIIQIVLINMLTAKKETKAIKPIQDIIKNGKTIPEVREIAQKGLKQI